jgi:hypothetical protein
MNYNTISAQRIAGALGAEIAGVDRARETFTARRCEFDRLHRPQVF